MDSCKFTWANVHAKNSISVDDLVDPFKASAKAFIKALEGAGATVDVGTTTRSGKRAYLFHWCWKVGLGKAKASQATAIVGVDIEWDHGDAEKSKNGAKEMIDGFGLACPPNSTNALRSTLTTLLAKRSIWLSYGQVR